VPAADSPQRTVLYVGLAVLALVIGWRYHATASSSGADQQYQAAGAAPSAQAPAAPPVVVVDVAGAVRRPGVYRLPSGARVEEAVRRARVTRAADLSGVNLAARLTDGEQIVVPRQGAAAASAADPGGSADPVVSINSGTLEQLETLDGIGPSLAQRIIDYRTAHGGFRSLEQLDDVSGIGPARLAALRGHVSL
jgi:competence protein ComEA